MRKYLTMAAIAASTFIASASFAAGDTTLNVGIPTANPAQGNSVESISTAVIDPFLAPIGLGSHYTRDKANAAFGELNGLKTDLKNALEAALLSSPEITKVNSLSLSINPVNAVFTQQGTSIGAEIGRFTVNGNANTTKKIPLVCSSIKATFTIEDVRVQAAYDVYTGDLHSSNAFYRITKKTASCDNLVGDAILAIGAIFLDISGEISDAIHDFFDGLSGATNAQTLFSVKAFLDGLKEFEDQNFLTAAATKAINAGQNLIETTNLNSGLQLNLSLYEGSTQNSIDIIASSQTVDVTMLEYTSNQISVDFTRPAGTSHVAFYGCSNNTTYCVQKGVSYYGNTAMISSAPRGTQIIAIGYNSHINGLPSLPGTNRTVNWDFNCVTDCPDIP